MAVESSNPASYRVNYNRRFAKLAIGLFVFGMIATFLFEFDTLGLSSDQSILWLIPLVICAPAMDDRPAVLSNPGFQGSSQDKSRKAA